MPEALHTAIIKINAAISSVNQARKEEDRDQVIVHIEPVRLTTGELDVLRRVAKCAPVVWVTDVPRETEE